MRSIGPLDPHHDGSALHVPEQDPSLGDTVPVFLRVPHAYAEARGVRGVHVRSVSDGQPRVEAAVVDRRDAHDTWWRADLLLHNPVTSYRFLVDQESGGYAWVDGTGTHDHDVTDAFDFRVTTHGAPPAWVRDSVVYQIFPDRFARSAAADERALPDWAAPAGWEDPVIYQGPLTPRQLYGGDLAGIVEHLDHLESLGVDLVYLTPFFPAESNHRYNATSFDVVDPILGGDDALRALTAAAHARGMHVIGDLTTNHSGDTHDWFRAAQGHPDHEEASFYYFRDHPSDYVAWFDVPSLPKLNHGSAALRRRLLEGPDSVAGRWLRSPYGLDGWRIDVANMTGRHGGDDYYGDVARALRRTAEQVNPDAFLVAEHMYDAGPDLPGDGWHGVMNYAAFTKPAWTWLNGGQHGLQFLGLPVGVPTWSGGQMATAMRAFGARTPWQSTQVAVNQLDSHDTPRFRTITGDSRLVEVGVGLQMTYPGVPMLFAGDELGLEGDDGEHSRTPMPWQRPELWDKELLESYRRLIALRRSTPALRHGGLRWVHAGDDAVAYLRETADQRVLVLLARRPHAGVRLPVSVLTPGVAPTSLYGDASLAVRDDEVHLPGDGPAVQVWQL